jgi:hypothetical protein
MKYIVEMGSHAMIYIPSFIKINPGIQNVNGLEGDSKISHFFSYFSHGVRLSPLGTAGTDYPIVPAPDDR